MPLLEFVGQGAQDSDSIVSDPSRLINLYRERAGEGTPWLKSVLGMMPHTELPGVFVEAMETVEGQLYAVCGGRLFRVRADGSFALLGDVDAGPATISGNNGSVAVQAGSRYFVWNGTTMSEPTPGQFNSFGSAEFFSNYTILTERNGRRFCWSSLATPATLPALNFSTADGKDDNIVRAMALHGSLYLFKQRSHELYFNTGLSGAAAFERHAGGVKDIGLRSHGLICRFAGGAFMVGSDSRASLITPSGLQPVSTPAVETAIQLKRPAYCVSYTDEGHEFVCIVFRDAPAWCFDIATGEWAERAEGQAMGPWQVMASARLGDRWYVGTGGGEIKVLQRTDIDGTVPLIREATSRTLYMEGARPVMREVEFFARQGFANVILQLSVSRDGGATWSPWKPLNLGGSGNYSRRAVWRNLGQFRRFNARIRWSLASSVNLSANARITL